MKIYTTHEVTRNKASGFIDHKIHMEVVRTKLRSISGETYYNFFYMDFHYIIYLYG